jgi:hypothetical protein
MQHEFYMQMALEGGFKKNKKREAYLARVEKLLVVFLVVLRSPACSWWRQRQRKEWKKTGWENRNKKLRRRLFLF